ncbi:hypothetical protein F0249_12045 [Vibrio sp. 03-59-1]|uniref:hypothetical protein n=1 Tax=Vibrio sp. 03-59-1 TaxID=2607607 RepID=UPI001493CE96|nr:hypothetical protein [Vibrio sp. 03-59-1]NOH84546.1 hypothetical protein [Vibrio sp. 03-59-1]
MLKKTLVALAIASVAGSAMAADITTTQYSVLSKQGAQGNDNVTIGQDVTPVTANIEDVIVTLNAEYKIDDLITFDFTGVDIDLAASSLITKVTLANDPDTSLPFGTMTLGLLTSTANQLVYRVTSLDYTQEKPENTTFNGTIELEGLQFEVASLLVSGKGMVTYSAKTSNDFVLDQEVTNATTIFDVKDQFAGDVDHKFDAVIDVNEQRLRFDSLDQTGSAHSTSVDSVELTAEEVAYTYGNNIAAQYSLPAEALAQVMTVNGDFSFLGEANETTGLIPTSNVAATFGVPKVYADKIVVEHNALTTNTITVDISGVDAGYADSQLSTQEFTANIDVKYDSYLDEKTNQVANVLVAGDAGEWTLNGAIVHVPFMPFRAGYSPVVTVSNTSSQKGDIEVLVYAKNDAEWAEPVSYMLTTPAKAEAMTNITGELQAQGIDGDVAFDVIVNAPADEIAVSALYYNNGDRAVVETHTRN